ncbi:MAG: phosphatidylglycerophosphatase A [Deltaproteobacteria bacterium]|nr:phosphatidylglycerophosphatase A [Deltaproteobacteria bacterium]
MKQSILFLSSGTYLGYIPVASGTFGTLWGLPLFYWLSGQGLWIQALIIIGSILSGVFLAGQAERIWGRKDPSRVVIDEIAGYLTTVFGLSFSWKIALAGFFLFRAMDIIKPYPIRKIDQSMPGGWGIVLDDVLAGIYCQIILRLLVYYQVI